MVMPAPVSPSSSGVIFLKYIVEDTEIKINAKKNITINFSYFKPSEYYNPDDNYFLTRFFARDTCVYGNPMDTREIL